MRKIELKDRRKSGEVQDFTRCDRCFGQVYRGEYCYRLGGRLICEACLPEAAQELLAPFRCRWEQGGWR